MHVPSPRPEVLTSLDKLPEPGTNLLPSTVSACGWPFQLRFFEDPDPVQHSDVFPSFQPERRRWSDTDRRKNVVVHKA